MAMEQGWIARAGIDVFDVEPLPADDPLLRLDHVVLAPHLGYVTRDNYQAFYDAALASVQAWLARAVLHPLI